MNRDEKVGEKEGRKEGRKWEREEDTKGMRYGKLTHHST